jgi:hypothetical protein
VARYWPLFSEFLNFSELIISSSGFVLLSSGPLTFTSCIPVVSFVLSSVPDPHPDPYVYGPPRSALDPLVTSTHPDPDPVLSLFSKKLLSGNNGCKIKC